MQRFAMSVLGLVALLLLTSPSVPAKDDKPSELKEIMTKANKTGTGLYANVVTELRADDTNWDGVKKDTKEIARLAAMLGKFDPPKGDKDSWQKLTKAYADNTKALEAAAAKMDKDAAKAASEKIGKSCDTCHMAHRKQ
jgi:cytochrome c556